MFWWERFWSRLPYFWFDEERDWLELRLWWIATYLMLSIIYPDKDYTFMIMRSKVWLGSRWWWATPISDTANTSTVCICSRLFSREMETQRNSFLTFTFSREMETSWNSFLAFTFSREMEASQNSILNFTFHKKDEQDMYCHYILYLIPPILKGNGKE